MKRNWIYSLEQHKNIWTAELNGIFAIKTDTVTFFFEHDGDFVEVILDKNGVLLSDTVYPLDVETLPRDWLLTKIDGHEYMVFDEENGFDIEKRSLIFRASEKFSAVYASYEENKISLEEDVFTFDDYVISHKGEWGYHCHKDGKRIWSVSLKAYLYTEMMRYGDTIVFGTSGQGGHFYGLDLHTGAVLFDINTKGTERYCYANGYFYVLSCGKKGKLLKVDLTGNIVEEMAFQNEINTDCAISLLGDTIYLLSVKKDKTPEIACITVNSEI